MLLGSGFAEGLAGTHRNAMATASKQMILALTGHGSSPLMAGVAPHAECSQWSETRAGSIIELDAIDDLTDRLQRIARELGLAVRAPRITCDWASEAAASYDGEWPGAFRVTDPGGTELCTVTAPLDGRARISVVRAGDMEPVEWLIDDGGEPSSSLTVSAVADGGDDSAFDLVSADLPDDRPVGGGAEVTITGTWRPEPQDIWSDQPEELLLPQQFVRFGVPDRETIWIEKLRKCKAFVWAARDRAEIGERAVAAELCEIEAPPRDTTFEISRAEGPAADELTWTITILSGDGQPEELPSGDVHVLKAGEQDVSVGALSGYFDGSEPIDGSPLSVTIRFLWRSGQGRELAKDDSPVTIGVPPPDPVDLLACADDPQVTAFTSEQIVVVTGCKLLSQERGDITAEVFRGDLDGVQWKLVEPDGGGDEPAVGEETPWTQVERITVEPDRPNRPLYVAVKHPPSEQLFGADADFVLEARWASGSVRPPDREPRKATVEFPTLTCREKVGAPREPIDGDRTQRARTAEICDVRAPPNGHAEISLDGADPDNRLTWSAETSGGPIDLSMVRPADADFSLGVASSPISLQDPSKFSEQLDVTLRWVSASGHESVMKREVGIGVGEPLPPPGLDCEGSPAPIREEVPETPLVVDTGCTLLAPTAGKVTVSVAGGIDGIPWRIRGGPVTLEPDDEDQPIRIETADLLKNRRYDSDTAFILTADWTSPDEFEQPAGRHQGEVRVELLPRIRLRCQRNPELAGSPTEVPEGPLVVDTGCTLLAPVKAGEVTVEPGGGFAGLRWVLPGEVWLSPGGDDLPILIETTEPLPNKRYEEKAEFALCATWRSPEGIGQSVGGCTEDGSEGELRQFDVFLPPRPDPAAAAWMTVGLLLGALGAAWLVLWLLARCTNPLPPAQEYRVVRRDVVVASGAGGDVQLSGFDVDEVLAAGPAPVMVERGDLVADGLRIRPRLRWWNPRDLLAGGSAAVTLPGDAGRVVVTSPTGRRAGTLPRQLADIALVLSVDRHASTGQAWLLVRRGVRAGRGTRDTVARRWSEISRRATSRRDEPRGFRPRRFADPLRSLLRDLQARRRATASGGPLGAGRVGDRPDAARRAQTAGGPADKGVLPPSSPRRRPPPRR